MIDIEKHNLLRRIANHLILHSSIMDDIGLFHGKMGVVLFFAHYTRFVKDTLYDEFVSDLLEEICENISENLPVNMEIGFCGIGWGIEYLIQQGFIEGDSDEILVDIDKKVMEWDVRRISDMSLPTGVKGISCYINKRIHSPRMETAPVPFDERYIYDWNLVCGKEELWSEIRILDSIIGQFDLDDDINNWRLGLNNGCAGLGLKLML